MAKINTLNYQTVAAWNGSQDLFVVEQPDGTKVATPEQVKQYVLGNSIDDIYSVMGQNGAKNLIPYPYYSESGYSNQGMTITYDADGVFTINKVAGTATAYYRIATLNFLKPSTKYRLVFEVENATSISIFLQKPTTGDYVTINNKSSGIFVAEFETTADSQISSRAIGLSCTASDTETNATVKVMLVYASDTDNTYRPYAKTNRQLTDELDTAREQIGDLSQTGLTGDSVAEQLDTAKEQIAAKRSKSVSSSVIGNGVNVASATSTSPYTTPHEGFVRFTGPTCLCVNDYRMMQSSTNVDYKGMWLPKGVSIYFADGTPPLAQWFNCSNE